MHYQIPPPLLTFHIKEEPPFAYTDVDFAGPLHIHLFSLSKSDQVSICLFTCLATRAAHLDTVTALTAKAFICCLKGFAGRRSLP